MKTSIYLFCLTAVFVNTSGLIYAVDPIDDELNEFKVLPVNGFVPDKSTAIAIAEAVLIPIYGKDIIEGEKPYNVTLIDDIWTITGSIPKGYVGGVFYIQISKIDARVIKVTHGM